MIGIMGVLIVVAGAFWLFKMGGLENIKSIAGLDNSPSLLETIKTGQSTITGAGTNNVAVNNQINRSNTSNGNINQSHGRVQQVSNINGVVTRNDSSFMTNVMPRI